MKRLILIGIGTGNPDHVTLAGMDAIRSADCILIPRKGVEKDELAEIRRGIAARARSSATVVEFDLPVRDTSMDYGEGVAKWHDAIADAWNAAVPTDAETVALLVWGDPSLYDSSLRIAARLEPVPETEVIPGITALQALTAAHSMPLNEINAPVLITTGRKIREKGWPTGIDRIAVMLDGDCSFQHLDPHGLRIWWGAFLGLPNQILKHGLLGEVGEEIVVVRRAARADHGWIMDTYILQRERD